MSSLDHLYGVVPGWAKVSHKTRENIRLTATAQKPSGASGRSYEIIIASGERDKIVVSEDRNAALLPACCIERHINPNATFCLHLDSSKAISDFDTAQDWWRSLGEYLNNQDFASRFRKWPVGAQLSHGDAALVQLRMEELAKPLGWKDELLSSMFRNKGWLSGALPRPTKDKASLVNVRSPCPRGCSRKHHPFRKESCERNRCVEGCVKQHRPILRTDCPHRSIVERLVLLEYERRRKEEDVVEHLRREGMKCCGTMDGCQLS